MQYIFGNILRVHRVMLMVLMGGALLLVSACTAVGVSSPEAPADSSSSEAEQSTAGDEAETADGAVSEIVIGQPTDINTLDPHQTATVGTDLSVISHLYTGLVIRGPDLSLQPALATSWEPTSDTVWQFKLRDDITFPNGEKLDANTVKWNVDRVKDPDLNARISSWFAPVTEVRVVDDTTVEFVTEAPYPALPDQLSMFFLLAPEWTAEHDPTSEAMGTGPYDLVEWARDDHVTLERKDEYWGEESPFETVTFRAIPENSSRVSGLLAGDFDVIRGVQPADFPRINDSGQATALSVPSTRTAMVKFNTLKEPFTDYRVRQALNYAVDKQLLIDTLLSGLDVEPSDGQVLTSDYFGYNPNLEPYPYDPEQAQQLLAEAGYPDGFEANLDVPTGTYLLGEDISQAIAGQLEAIGVRVNVTEMPFSVYMDKYLQERDLAQMAYITLAWPTIDADGLLTLFQAGNRYAYWENAEFSELLNEARSTTDPETRQELYEQATAIMRERPPVIFLFPQPATFGVANTIEWAGRSDDWIRVWEMSPVN